MGENASQIREAIDQTRDQLSDTLEALSYKTDLPARAGEALVSGVGSAKETVEKAMEHVRSSFEDTTKSVRSTVKDTSDTVSNSLKDLSHRSEPLVHAGQEQLQRVSSLADDAITKSVTTGIRFVRENPVTATIGAVLFGIMIDRLLPRRQSS